MHQISRKQRLLAILLPLFADQKGKGRTACSIYGQYAHRIRSCLPLSNLALALIPGQHPR